MKIVIFGATGMVGSRLVAEASGRGHHVTAASRRPSFTPESELVEPAQVDVSSPGAVAAVLAGADVAILTIRPESGSENLISGLTSTVLGQAARTGVRILVIGGAAPLLSPNDPGLLVGHDPEFVPAAWREVAHASIAQLRVCERQQQADWTYLSPASLLEPGVRTGSYRRGTTTLLTDQNGVSRISVEDLAVAAIDELEQPGMNRHFTVADSLPGPSTLP